MNVLVISSRQQIWQALVPDFQARSFTLCFSDSLDKALDLLRKNPPLVVILDSESYNGSERTDAYIQKIREDLTCILEIDAMIYTAVVSGLDPAELHDALEGYGVLLGIPSKPGPDDAARLAESLKKCNIA